MPLLRRKSSQLLWNLEVDSVTEMTMVLLHPLVRHSSCLLLSLKVTAARPWFQLSLSLIGKRILFALALRPTGLYLISGDV